MRARFTAGPEITIAHDDADSGGPAVYIVINGDVAIELTTELARAIGTGLATHAFQADRESVMTR